MALVTDEKVMEFVDGPLEENMAQRLFESFVKEEKKDVFAVWSKDSTGYIGHAALTDSDISTEKEILFYLTPDFWGKGLATEVGLALVKFAKNQTNISAIIATLDTDHIASQRVCQKIGLKLYEKGQDEKGEFLIYRMDL